MDKQLADTPFSGHYFLRKLVNFSLFSLQLVHTVNNFEVILAAREEEYKKFISGIWKFYILAIFLPILIFQSTIGQYFLDRENDI